MKIDLYYSQVPSESLVKFKVNQDNQEKRQNRTQLGEPHWSLSRISLVPLVPLVPGLSCETNREFREHSPPRSPQKDGEPGRRGTPANASIFID